MGNTQSTGDTVFPNNVIPCHVGLDQSNIHVSWPKTKFQLFELYAGGGEGWREPRLSLKHWDPVDDLSTPEELVYKDKELYLIYGRDATLKDDEEFAVQVGDEEIVLQGFVLEDQWESFLVLKRQLLHCGYSNVNTEAVCVLSPSQMFWVAIQQGCYNEIEFLIRHCGKEIDLFYEHFNCSTIMIIQNARILQNICEVMSPKKLKELFLRDDLLKIPLCRCLLMQKPIRSLINIIWEINQAWVQSECYLTCTLDIILKEFNVEDSNQVHMKGMTPFYLCLLSKDSAYDSLCSMLSIFSNRRIQNYLMKNPLVSLDYIYLLSSAISKAMTPLLQFDQDDVLYDVLQSVEFYLNPFVLKNGSGVGLFTLAVNYNSQNIIKYLLYRLQTMSHKFISEFFLKNESIIQKLKEDDIWRKHLESLEFFEQSHEIVSPPHMLISSMESIDTSIQCVIYVQSILRERKVFHQLQEKWETLKRECLFHYQKLRFPFKNRALFCFQNRIPSINSIGNCIKLAEVLKRRSTPLMTEAEFIKHTGMIREGIQNHLRNNPNLLNIININYEEIILVNNPSKQNHPERNRHPMTSAESHDFEKQPNPDQKLDSVIAHFFHSDFSSRFNDGCAVLYLRCCNEEPIK